MEEEPLLNPEQKRAVEHLEGPMLVIAGAGSGKTRIVTFRIAHLLKVGVPASQILAVTFTNKAANEMRQRIETLCHVLVFTSTFHSLGARILRESIDHLGYLKSFTIFDEDDSEKVLKDCLAFLGIKDEKGVLKKVGSEISRCKNNLIEPEALALDNPLAADVYKLYQARLKEYNALDFDDLLFLPVKLFKEHPDVLKSYQMRFSFILIDEYQDTNGAQYMLIKLLAGKHSNVFAVGDPDQSIYSWRGANVQNILNFERDFPGAQVVFLEENYRSPDLFLKASNALISHNSNRFEKKLWSNKKATEKIGFYIAENDQAEADFVIDRLVYHHRIDKIPLSEFVIFYRTNFQSRIFEDALLRQKIPYQIIGSLSFYQRREIKDLLCFLRVVLAGSDFLSFSRTVNLPKRGLGEATLVKLRLFAAERQVDLITACREIIENPSLCKLSSKQLEGLKDYIGAVFSVRALLQASEPLPDLLKSAIDQLRYLDHLKEDPESYEERRGNLEELISKAAAWSEEAETLTLFNFLEELSLKANLAEDVGFETPIRLMTIHNGKGLEFRVVFLVGMEEDLFPHINTKDSLEALEEERRLCYVGMTRAKEMLYLTASRRRFLWGGARLMRPSRFLMEIPEEYLHPLHRKAREAQTVMEEDFPSSFSVGEAVYHRDFGTGIIQKSYQTSLGLTYDIFFPQVQTTRSLVAKFAKLMPVTALLE